MSTSSVTIKAEAGAIVYMPKGEALTVTTDCEGVLTGYNAYLIGRGTRLIRKMVSRPTLFEQAFIRRLWCMSSRSYWP